MISLFLHVSVHVHVTASHDNGRHNCPPQVCPAHMWAHVPTPVPDALFHLNQRFQDDPCPTKLGLGVGAYRSEEGTPYVLEVVREAEAALAQGRAGTRGGAEAGGVELRLGIVVAHHCPTCVP